jgi:hypothetical protein
VGEVEENRKAEVEEEINRWNGFARVLRTEDKQAFDEAMNTYRGFASETADPVNLAAFEQMMLSITMGQMSRLNKLEPRLDQIDPPKPEPQPCANQPKPAEPMISYVKPAPKKAQNGLFDFG